MIACSDGGADPSVGGMGAGHGDGSAGVGTGGAGHGGGHDAGSSGAHAGAGAQAGAGAAGSGGTVAEPADRDGDGVLDEDDAFPDDPSESVDSDRDGVGDGADPSPDNLLECGDADRDGCDDCVTGRSDPDKDGPDADDDGACDGCDAARCSGQGVCKASATGAVCQCERPWSGDDCSVDADTCAEGDPADDNPCNTEDAAATCSDIAAPSATYLCNCTAGYAFDGVTCVVADGFLGDQVSAMMPTIAAGPDFGTGPSAIIGPGVEFSSRNQPGLAGVDLDIAADSFTFSLVNENPDGAFNQGLLRIEITDLHSLEDRQAEIAAVTLVSSTFPEDTFDAVSFGPHSVTLDVSAPNLLIPKLTTWSATFAVDMQ